MSRLTLAQQLKQLESAAPIQEADPENAYSSLGTYNPRHGEEEDEGDEARAHYGDVGKSSLRDPTLSTLSHLDAKYNSTGHGKQQQQQTTSKTKKVKVFDDDLSEDEDEERIFAGEDGLDASGSENDEDEGDSDDDDAEEDEENEDEDDEEEEEDEESENDDTQPTTHRALSTPKTAPSANGNTKLDPVAAIRASKNKEIEKGRAILRQQKLFDDLVAVRISFAKAWQAGSKVPLLQPQSRAGKRSIDDVDAETGEPTGPAEALEAMNATLADNRAQMLRSLHSLSEDLFSVRERIGRALPGMIDAASGRERKRRKFDEEEVDEEERDDVIGYQTYWKSCADDSFGLLDSSHDVLVTTLNKWSTKIQAASIQQATLAGKNNGNKFSVTTAGTGVLEAIDGSLNAKAMSLPTPNDIFPAEEQFYKSLLREVIEARAGGTGGSGIDVSHLRSEKKKKRDAERGASKGRRIRYTVHEKAQNFTAPTPLETIWQTEQIDELFTSLLGGVGMEGAGADQDDRGVMGAVVDGDAGLGGLRVF